MVHAREQVFAVKFKLLAAALRKSIQYSSCFKQVLGCLSFFRVS
jgi:hypothetical protein